MINRTASLRAWQEAAKGENCAKGHQPLDASCNLILQELPLPAGSVYQEHSARRSRSSTSTLQEN
jgi:hypothetical protein